MFFPKANIRPLNSVSVGKTNYFRKPLSIRGSLQKASNLANIPIYVDFTVKLVIPFNYKSRIGKVTFFFCFVQKKPKIFLFSIFRSIRMSTKRNFLEKSAEILDKFPRPMDI